MNTQILTVILAASLALPATALANEPGARKEKMKAYREQQQTENKAFRETLKDMPQDQREAAIVNHRNSQFEENLSNLAKEHQEHMTQLQAKLAANPKLTDAQKQEILSKTENRYQQKVATIKTKHTEGMDYAQQVAHDPNLTPEQKQAKMKEYRGKNKEEMKAQHVQEKQKREARREEFRKKHQTNASLNTPTN